MTQFGISLITIKVQSQKLKNYLLLIIINNKCGIYINKGELWLIYICRDNI